MATPVRLALCGFGRAGLFHFNSIRSNPKVRLDHVIEIPSQLKAAKETLSSFGMDHVRLHSTDDYETNVLTDDNINGVVVATPTDTHERYVRSALKAGKGVLCEKPIAQSTQVIKLCYNEANTAGRPLLCGFQRRFDPGFSGLKNRIKELGTIYTIKTISRDHPPSPIEYLLSSQGISHDSAIHDFDMVCWLTGGEEPQEVYAQGHAHNHQLALVNDVDVVTVTMKFPSGIIATIDICRYSQSGYDQRLEVHGEKGSLSVINPDREPVVMATKEGVIHSQYSDSCTTRYVEAYREEMNHFIDVLTDDSLPLRVSGDQVLLAARIADACKRSLDTKQPEQLAKI